MEGVRVPFLADICNSQTFTAFADWRADAGLREVGVYGPARACHAISMQAQIFMGVQARAGAARQAPPPLVPFGLDPEVHFQRALEAARRPLPNEDPPLADEDLRFAAFAMVNRREYMKADRSEAVKLIKENGARSITVVFIHPVLSPGTIEKLVELPVDRFITTDTIPIAADRRAKFGKRLQVVSIASLLGEVITRANEGRSVGQLFNE